MTADHEAQLGTWQERDALAIGRAVNAVLDQAIAAGTQPDWTTYSALLGMLGRLRPQAPIPADHDAIWRRATPLQWDGECDVFTLRELVRQDLAGLLDWLDRSSDAKPHDSTRELALFVIYCGELLRWLEGKLNLVIAERVDGALN